MINFFDSLTVVAQQAQDWELPSNLLPNVIASEAALLSGFEAGHSAHDLWPQ